MPIQPAELQAALQREGFSLLAELDPEQNLRMLTRICEKEGQEVTIGNMLEFVPAIESDLEHSRLTSGS